MNCVLEDRVCNHCGACDTCDLNVAKICDNCCVCLESKASEMRTIIVRKEEIEPDAPPVPPQKIYRKHFKK